MAPTPNLAYTVEMWYHETPERLGNGSGTTSQQLLYQTTHQRFYCMGAVRSIFILEKYTRYANIQQKFQTAFKLLLMSRWDVNEEMSM